MGIAKKKGITKTTIVLLVILVGLVAWTRPWTLFQTSTNEKYLPFPQAPGIDAIKRDVDRFIQGYNANKPYNMPPAFNPFR
jgi:hypothetical protein